MRGSWHEVFGVFLKLGLTSFGGPVAHLGYFRAEFVDRRRWLSDREYGELVALCQFLPGPASSQVGFAVGLLRGGIRGALAAFAAFTLPSAVLMVAFASGAELLGGTIGEGLLTGLKLVAIAIVAQAVLAMARSLTPDVPRAGIALGTLALVALVGGSLAQIVAIVLGAAAGLALCRQAQAGAGSTEPLRFPVQRAWGIGCLISCALLLVGAPAIAALTGSGTMRLFDAFVRAGALVFGGGHVVLPLLHEAVVAPGWVSEEQFLTGYGAAQAMPGPLFTVAAYLGFVSTMGPGGLVGAAVALVAVFLPGMLLLTGTLPFWNAFRRRAWAQAAVRGANAAVVGILAAALVSLIATSSAEGPWPLGLAAVCFVLLVAFRVPPWAVVVVGACGGALLAVLAPR